jgi:hypothetical protein
MLRSYAHRAELRHTYRMRKETRSHTAPEAARTDEQEMSCPPDDLLTRCGALARLNLSDPDTLLRLLLADKLQVTEGLVVEHFFDRITDCVPEECVEHASGSETPAATHGRRSHGPDAETFIVDTGEERKKWLACVFSRGPADDPLLLRYVRALEKVFDVLLIRWHETHPHLRVRASVPELSQTSEEPLALRMRSLSGRDREPFRPATAGQG